MTSDFREAKYRAQSRSVSGEPSWVRSRHVRAARLLMVLIATVGTAFAPKPGEAKLIPGRTPDGRSGTELRAQDSGPVSFDDPDSKGVRSMAFTADGKFLATADANGRTYVWSVVTRKIAATLRDPGSHGVNAVAFRPGSSVLAAGDANGRVYLWVRALAGLRSAWQRPRRVRPLPGGASGRHGPVQSRDWLLALSPR
jgi:WD40 repeat protein